MIEKVNESQLQVLKHALGLDWSKFPYRNHFAARVGHADWPTLLMCSKLGLMELASKDRSGMHFFRATEKGARAVGTSLSKIPR